MFVPPAGELRAYGKISFNAGENAEKIGGWSGTTHVQFTEKHDERRIPAKSVATETEPPGNLLSDRLRHQHGTAKVVRERIRGQYGQ